MDEIEARLQQDAYAHKYATCAFHCEENNTLNVTITDEGQGFDWQQYMKLDPARVFDNHGRGIAFSDGSFSQIIYNDIGNQVTVKLKAKLGHYTAS